MKLLLNSLVTLNFKRLIHTESPKTPVLVRDAINLWEGIFKKNNISEPNDSILLIMHSVLRARRLVDVQTQLNNELNLMQRRQLDEYCLQRLTRMPVQYIIGEWDFRELTLAMRAPVFVPRPETEQLIELIVEEHRPPCHTPHRVVEIGCGSGAISIALANAFKQAEIVAIDRSEEACNLTRENCARFEFCDSARVHVLNTRLLENGSLTNAQQLTDVDILVSNPPYIKTDVINTLQPEITLYEDLLALDGGPDGMRIIEGVLKLAASALRDSTGRLYMEIDPSLVESIQLRLNKNNSGLMGLTLDRVVKDVFGVDRFVCIGKRGLSEK